MWDKRAKWREPGYKLISVIPGLDIIALVNACLKDRNSLDLLSNDGEIGGYVIDQLDPLPNHHWIGDFKPGRIGPVFEDDQGHHPEAIFFAEDPEE